MIAIDTTVLAYLVHDARVAAICRANGVREIWTADRDYTRFPGLRLSNPLIRQP